MMEEMILAAQGPCPELHAQGGCRREKLDRRDDRGARKGLCGSSGDEPSIAARVRIEKRLQF
jgi:hypothetical protein